MSAFPNLTARTRFPREVDLKNVLLASRTVWPEEVAICNPQNLQSLENGMAQVSWPMPKPPGQVSEVNKGGYSLSSVLGWEGKWYKTVQVSVVLILFRAIFDIIVPRTRFMPKQNLRSTLGNLTVSKGRKRYHVCVELYVVRINCPGETFTADEFRRRSLRNMTSCTRSTRTTGRLKIF